MTVTFCTLDSHSPGERSLLDVLDDTQGVRDGQVGPCSGNRLRVMPNPRAIPCMMTRAALSAYLDGMPWRSIQECMRTGLMQECGARSGGPGCPKGTAAGGA